MKSLRLGLLVIAVAAAMVISITIFLSPVSAITYPVASCQTSSNGNAVAFVEVSMVNGAYFLYHESWLHHFTSNSASWRWLDVVDLKHEYSWSGNFNSGTLDFSQIQTYALYYSTSTVTNDATSGGNSSGIIRQGIAYPSCPYNGPVQK